MSRAALSLPPAINNSPTIATFVVYAGQNVTLGTADHSVGGDIGVATSTGSAAQIVVGGLDVLDPACNLYSPSVSLGGLAVVGDIETNALQNNGGLFNTQAAYPASAMPPLPAILPASPGASGVTVAALQSQTLTPGSYGALIDDGTVLLTSGTYSFASVTLGTGAQLLSQLGSTTVLVAGTFAAGPLTHVLPVAQPANALTISVATSDGTGASQPAVSIGGGSQITALLAAPNGTLSLGDGVQATGAFTGLNVSAGNNVALTFQSGFANARPSITTFVAYAELSLALGTEDHVIGGDLGVAATGATSAGTQLTVGSLDAIDPSHILYAPSVSLGSLSVVGDVDANTLTNSGSLFGAQAPYPVSAMPPLPLALPGAAGTSNVTVAQGQVETLSPGNYGTLADNGVLLLNPGPYSFASIVLGDGAQLQALPGGSTSILVAGTLSTGTFAQIAPILQAASQFTISVAGSDGTNGSPPAALIGDSTKITALLSAPRGTLSLSDNVLATGAFGGFALKTGSNVTLAFQGGFPPASQQPVGQQNLSASFLPAVTTSPLVGTLPGSTVLSLRIALPLQLNGATGSGFPPLTTFIDSLSSSHPPPPLTPATFAAAYGPSTSDYSTVSSFATASGLTIARTFGSRAQLSVTGTAAAIESAFFVTLNEYQRADGTIFYAPANAPSTNLSVPIVGVLGLDSFSRPVRTQVLTGPPFATGTTSSNLLCPLSPIGARNGFFGRDFVSSYFADGAGSGCVGNLEGQEQTVAVVALDGYVPGDVLAYAQGAATTMPPPSPLDVPGLMQNTLSNVTQEIAPSSTSLPFGTFTSPVTNSESALDIDMLLAMAPQANIIVYETPNSDPDALLAQIADEDKAQIITDSWHWGPGNTSAEQMDIWNITAQFASQSQTYVASAGDHGSFVASDPYVTGVSGPQPKADEPIIDSPFITVVGGTELGGAGETTWNDTTVPRSVDGVLGNSATAGGFCTGPSPNPNPNGPSLLSALPLPSWQQGLNMYNNPEIANPPARMVPDVSMVADGIAIACGVGAGGCGQNGSTGGAEAICVGGTSAAAPLWAGFMALVNQANGVGGMSSHTPIGFANPILYQLATSTSTAADYTGDFNDVADNSNNNWFDDGQTTEIGIINATSTSVWAPNSVDANGDRSLLQGAAIDGTSEAPGLYHAVKGYDLANGLGSPNCGLLNALAPSTKPPPPPTAPPPGVVTITYHQVGECNAFPENSAPISLGPGHEFVIFGIDSIENAESTVFDFNPHQLFAGAGDFPLSSLCGTTAACEASLPPGGCPLICFPAQAAISVSIGAHTTLTLTGGGPFVGGTQFIYAEVPSSATTEDSFFLSYSQAPEVSPAAGGALAPNVTLVKSNATAAQIAGLPFVSDCATITLQ